MKSLKAIREQYISIDKTDTIEKELDAIIASGFLHESKRAITKRALQNEGNLNNAERRALNELVHVLMKQTTGQISTVNEVSLINPMKNQPWPSDREMPLLLTIYRKSFRVMGDNVKVGIYYAPTIDRYITIPFTEVGISENYITEELSMPVKRPDLFEHYDSPGMRLRARLDIQRVDEGLGTVLSGAFKAAKSLGGRMMKGNNAASQQTQDAPSRLGDAPARRSKQSIVNPFESDNERDEREDQETKDRVRELEAEKEAEDKESGNESNAKRFFRGFGRGIRKTTNIHEQITLVYGQKEVSVPYNLAYRINKIYENANKSNKQKIVRMLNEDYESYKKLANFALRN